MRKPARAPGTALDAKVRATAGALGLVLLLASCGLLPAPPGGTSAPGQTQGGATSPASPTPSGSPSEATPSSGWKTFTTTDGALAFDYPAGWTVKDPGGALGGDFVDVFNAEGKSIAGLRTNIVTGAECVGKSPYQVYDSAPMVALAEGGGGDGGVPRYVFESRGDDPDAVATRSTIAAYGITMVPEESGDLACPMFHLFLWPPSGAFFGGTYNPENNATPGDPALPYLEKARLYAATPEYQDIRKMITSLRPGRSSTASPGTPTGTSTGK
ncbi:hypothetical protein NicSoilB4_07660 [Arthrobacter sp. NicSoilB4]|uniref:hypothetical protein n=1 Tax=Arthrobacter sp. NicSoilB4 TaxID=2830997 RepID=UPI001CC7545C|nr:hypothetical protein [Arthrobacter sp. NicSoilB4]BCW66003.1 hypothetical protein NicSoilB4_07660 [Arthrobacter sp. NicSoilB4]